MCCENLSQKRRFCGLEIVKVLPPCDISNTTDLKTSAAISDQTVHLVCLDHQLSSDKNRK